jgi:beta-lactam-binding protein with PASTA domain
LAALILAAVVYYFIPQPGVKIPDVRGITLADAAVKLGAAGLSIGKTTTQLDASKAAETVIAQSPLPGASVGKGDKIDLVLSRQLVQVPDLIGQSLDSAKAALKDTQLGVGETRPESAQGKADNTVLRESPAAGEWVNPGAKVDLVYAKVSGPVVPSPITPPPLVAKVAVPNVVGKTLDQARSQLANSGLRLGNSTTQVTAGTAAGTVLSQSPNSGQQVARDSRVDVVLAQYPPTQPISVSAWSSPQQLSSGGTATITVTARDPGGSTIPNARVTVSTGGGTFVTSGTTSVTGNTDQNGVYRVSWRAPAPKAAPSYTIGITVTKEGFQQGSDQTTVNMSGNPGGSANNATQPGIYSQGQVKIRGTWLCDLDKGVEDGQPGADFFLENFTASSRALVPRNGARFQVVGGGRPFSSISYSELKAVAYGNGKIDRSDGPNNRLPAGTVVAYVTNEGRYGKFVVVKDDGQSGITITWLTYSNP